MRALLSRFRTDDRGATAIEYGLIVALIFLVIVTSVAAFSERTGTMYETIRTAIVAAIN